jgi:hypothetical protein
MSLKVGWLKWKKNIEVRRLRLLLPSKLTLSKVKVKRDRAVAAVQSHQPH